jgi:hypothetical protein
VRWTLRHDGVPVARLAQVDYDQPWFVCDFVREPGFAAVAGDEESEWLESHATLMAGDDPAQPPIRPFMLRVDGDVAYLRI